MRLCQLSASSDMSLQQLSSIRCCLSSSSGDAAGEGQDHQGAQGKQPQLLVRAVLGSGWHLKCPDFHSNDGFLLCFTKVKFLNPLKNISRVSRKTFKETQTVCCPFLQNLAWLFNAFISKFILWKIKIPPEERHGFKKDYTNSVGWNITKTNKRNPTFTFLSSIMIFKSTLCFRDVKQLISNSVSCFECAIMETERKVTSLKSTFMSVTITAKNSS